MNAKYGRIKKKGLDNCQDPSIMDVKKIGYFSNLRRMRLTVSGVTPKKEAILLRVQYL